MKKDPKVFVSHIIESIKAIEKYTHTLSEQDFLESTEKQDAVMRRIEIIGEAIKNLPEDFQKQYPAIPWQDIAAMRNKLIHEYFGVDLALVWEVVKTDLPTLKKQIEKIF